MEKLKQLYLIVFNIWMKIPEKIRYLLVGGYNTIVSYALYAGILWVMNGRHEQVALALSFFISSLNSYWTQKIFVFATHGNVKKEYVKCLTAWGISYLMNVALLALFVDGLKLNPYAAQIMALVIVTINSWLMLKHFAFKEGKNEKTGL